MARSSPAAEPERVCPHCSTVARTTDQRCPFCRRSYYRSGLGAMAGMLTLAVIVLLAGTAALLLGFFQLFDDELTRQVDVVRQELEQQLDRRLGPGG